MRTSELILVFFIYSFIGWIWESFICSPVELDKIHNRGFLLGPCCPIYGLGTTISYLLLKDMGSVMQIFIFSSLTSCFLEYAIGIILEKSFHKKWWDYEKYAFNIKGRVCLYGFVIFGITNIAIVKLLTPSFLIFMSLTPEKALNNISIVLMLLLIFDIFITVNHLRGGCGFPERIYEYFETRNREYFLDINNSDRFSKLDHFKDSGIVKEKLDLFNDNLKYKEKNIKKYKKQKILKIKSKIL